MSSLLLPEKRTRERRDEDGKASLYVGDLIQTAQRLLDDEIIREARKILKEGSERIHEGHTFLGTGRQETRRNMESPRISDHAIYSFILKNDGRPTKRDEVCDAFCTNEEARRAVAEKLSLMERFGLIAVKGDLLVLKNR
ncbi:MAG: hypothetical protein NWE76_09575 [Candidatus Bathyarchaeota archaeon]|nr:hypothetical protein [Candidatus Bathyarchaeota archaeon]